MPDVTAPDIHAHTHAHTPDNHHGATPAVPDDEIVNVNPVEVELVKVLDEEGASTSTKRLRHIFDNIFNKKKSDEHNHNLDDYNKKKYEEDVKIAEEKNKYWANLRKAANERHTATIYDEKTQSARPATVNGFGIETTTDPIKNEDEEDDKKENEATPPEDFIPRKNDGNPKVVRGTGLLAKIMERNNRPNVWTNLSNSVDKAKAEIDEQGNYPPLPPRPPEIEEPEEPEEPPITRPYVKDYDGGNREVIRGTGLLAWLFQRKRQETQWGTLSKSVDETKKVIDEQGNYPPLPPRPPEVQVAEPPEVPPVTRPYERDYEGGNREVIRGTGLLARLLQRKRNETLWGALSRSVDKTKRTIYDQGNYPTIGGKKRRPRR